MTSNQLHQPAAEIPAGIFATQAHGGQCRWIERTRDDLLAVLQSETPPEFRTVLGVVQRDDEGEPTHLDGPFYADFDGPLDETIGDLQAFIRKLQVHGLDMAQVRTFATGGRGFHLEIPEQCLMPKVPDGGTRDLHKIYKAMAESMAVDTLDLRVYSVRRMWRTPDVRRPNGLYKTPLTVSELMTLTPDRYTELCSAPRPFPALASPTLAPGLGMLFSTCRDKVVADARKKKPSSKTAEAMRARFLPMGAPLPPSLLGIAAGLIPAREGIGFNQIALQLCTAGIGMGLDEDQLVTLSQGLIEHHKGDGERYDTPRKRERELRDMFRFAERSNYVPSIGGIRSILPAGMPCRDLRGI